MGKSSGRYRFLTPNMTVVGMNDLVDIIIDLDLKPTLRGKPLTDPTAPSPMVNLNGLRFTFFVGGNMVSKGITKCIKQMENKEWRHKLAMREWQGLLARHEDRVDINALTVGWTGGMAK